MIFKKASRLLKGCFFFFFFFFTSCLTVPSIHVGRFFRPFFAYRTSHSPSRSNGSSFSSFSVPAADFFFLFFFFASGLLLLLLLLLLLVFFLFSGAENVPTLPPVAVVVVVVVVVAPPPGRFEVGAVKRVRDGGTKLRAISVPRQNFKKVAKKLATT
jgi:hypothetical protein